MARDQVAAAKDDTQWGRASVSDEDGLRTCMWHERLKLYRWVSGSFRRLNLCSATVLSDIVAEVAPSMLSVHAIGASTAD